MAKVNIMIVEDNAITAMDIENQLKNLGYGVTAKVSYGEEAIQKAKENTPDLVLMDIVLKGEMDGIEAAEEIRTQLDIPVIFLTSFADKDRLKRAKLAYPFGFLLKPFQNKDLKVTIEMALYVFKVDAERTQAEEALRESEKFLQDVFNAIRDGISVLDLNLKIIRVNSWMEEMYPKEGDLAGRKCYEVYQKRDTPCPWCPSLKAIETGEIHSAIVPYPSEENPTGWIEVSSFPLRNTEGDMVGVIEHIKDIAQHIQIQSALKKANDIINRSPAVVFLWKNAEEWPVEFASDNVKELFGYAVEEFSSGKVSYVETVHPDDLERVAEEVSTFSKEKERKEFYHEPYRIITKNGEVKWLDDRTYIRRDEKGNITHYEGIVIDITDRMRIEEDKKKLETQLQQAQKMETIGTLAGGIAHEFNNILSIIIGNAEVALDDVPDSFAKECLDEIRSASLRASDVVRQILSFARKSITERKPVQISPIIKDSIRLLRASIPATIKISQNISCKFDTVLADSTQISQVVMNLCTNAAQAMGEHGGVLKVTLKNVEFENQDAGLDLKPGRYVKLTVSDTGHGIEPEIADRIFDPYFTTKEVEKGTGMGLSVVHGIVKSCNGTITVHSEPGKETVFQVLLPVIEAETEPKDEKPEALPTGTERILFVDDEQSLVKVTRRILERLGYEVETKLSPVEALELFGSGPDRFDLVITDMTMPQMTGQKLVKEILNIRSDMPIILCTGFSEKISKEKAGELGINALVLKPFVVRDFALTVRKVLDAKM